MASKAAMALRLARLSSWVPSLAQIVFTPEDGLQIVNVTAFLLCRDQSVRGGRFRMHDPAVFTCSTQVVFAGAAGQALNSLSDYCWLMVFCGEITPHLLR